MSKIFIANWKVHPDKVEDAILLTKEISSKNTIICPPYIYLEAVIKNMRQGSLGAQNVGFNSEKKDSPLSGEVGEVSIEELKNLGVKYIILGHSSRRKYYQEDDILISHKVNLTLKNNITPIVCIGEKDNVERNLVNEFIKEEVRRLGSSIDPLYLNNKKEFIIAYEPWWAIRAEGGKETLEPKKIQETYIVIKKEWERLFDSSYLNNLKVLYGGSVTSKNSFEIIPYVDGFLVGSASLNPKEWQQITKITPIT